LRYLRTLNEWFDPTDFTPVPPNEARFGTAGFNSVYGPGAVNLDLSLFREFKLTEGWKLQLRAECFNFTNTPHFSNPDSYVSFAQYGANGDGTPNYSQILNLNGFDQISSVNPASRLVDQRYWRLGLKIVF
jgi:hypothetical protein